MGDVVMLVKQIQNQQLSDIIGETLTVLGLLPEELLLQSLKDTPAVRVVLTATFLCNQLWQIHKRDAYLILRR